MLFMSVPNFTKVELSTSPTTATLLDCIGSWISFGSRIFRIVDSYASTVFPALPCVSNQEVPQTFVSVQLLTSCACINTPSTSP